MLYPQRPAHRFAGLIPTLMLAACLASPASAAAPTLLHSFAPVTASSNGGGSETNTDGANPYARIIQGSDGLWYGNTYQGGLNGAGTIFRMNPDGSGFTVLKSFNFDVNGSNPAGPLVQGSDGFLYGCTDGDGANNTGTIFKVSRDGQTFVTLHPFDPYTQANPNSGGGDVIQGSDGVLYGETGVGTGSLFRMNTDGTGYQTLHTFAALNSDGTNIGGGHLGVNPTEGNDGFLYGVTVQGGTNGAGVVYKIAKNGNGFTVLHNFDAAPSGSLLPGPSAPLLKGQDGAFYGVTYVQGTNNTGSMFRIDTSGNFQTLASFPALSTNTVPTNTAGANPLDGSGLTQGPDGTLYGVTYAGGAYGQGTVFAIRPDGGGLRSLLDFQASDINHFSGYDDIGNRFHVTFGSNGLLYITTDGGGSNGVGAILSLSIPTPPTHILWTNTNGTASLWDYSTTSGAYTANNFGPYNGWTAKAIADGGTDGKTRLLWTNTNGTAALWNVTGSTGAFTASNFGPYTNWTAKAVSVGSDNTTHMLWTNTNGTAALWNVVGGAYQGEHDFGPYSGWTAKSIADGSDGKTRFLWTNTNGQAAFWNVTPSTGAFSQFTFGPYAGWTAKAISVSSIITHVLWTNTNGTAAVWNYTPSTGGFTQASYGPYSGWSANGLADGSDGKVRLLWNNVSGAASFWSVDNATGVFSQFSFGPYSGWTATGVSANQ